MDVSKSVMKRERNIERIESGGARGPGVFKVSLKAGRLSFSPFSS